MKIEVYDHSANYTATVVKLPVKQRVEGLDNLVMVELFGNKCLIGKDSDEDQLYLFFPSGTRLSQEFLSANNLFRECQLNADVNQKGFFEENGRVKAIKFRGIISSGFVIPVTALYNIFPSKEFTQNTDSIKEGVEFNEFNGVEICRKYIVKAEQVPGEKKDRTNKINDRLSNLLIPNQFRFHTDTAHLAKHLSNIKPSDMIVITDKWHGSSSILAKVLVAKKLNLWQKFINLLGGQVPNKELGYIYSSGKPKSNLPKGIEGSWINDGPDFYTSNIWKRAFDDNKNKIEDGISIYGELVGFEKDSESAIQKGYDYGCVPFSKGGTIRSENFITEEVVYTKVPPQYRMVVYRITYTKPNGEVIEFTWQQIKDYCKKYDLETVKEIYFGPAGGVVNNEFDEDDNFGEIFFQQLQQTLESLGNCMYCANRVPTEGIVVRKDGGPAYKLKSSAFLADESTNADNNEVNIEDNA